MDIKRTYEAFYDVITQIHDLKKVNQKEKELRKKAEKERNELEYDKDYYVKELEEERSLRIHLEATNEYYKTQIKKYCIFDGERN